MLKVSIVVMLLIVGFTACNAEKKVTGNMLPANQPPQRMNETFDKQGHRGCRGLMPENTVAAMMNAIGMGVTTLEMDVVITKDKQVILSHEPFFNHEITTKPDRNFVTAAEEKSLNIYQMDYETVKKYDVGMKPHPRFPKQEKIKAVKPLLSEVLEAVKQYMITARRPYPYFNIETKSMAVTDDIYHPKPAEFVELLMQVIKEKQLENQVIIQSFDIRTLQYLHQHYPDIKTALLVESDTEGSFSDQLKALGFTPTIYSPEHVLVNESLIKTCHDRQVQVIPWTVNDKAIIASLIKMGVDGIITDYPDLF